MAELTDFKTAKEVKYKLTFNVDAEAYEQALVMQKDLTKKGMNAWFSAELKEQFAKAGYELKE
jgi:hypothetical protein